MPVENIKRGSLRPYSISEIGLIRPADDTTLAIPASRPRQEGGTFTDELKRAGRLWIDFSTYGRIGERWISDLKKLWWLDIEQGAALVTGVNCCQGTGVCFEWEGQKYYPIRPDFGLLLFETDCAMPPLNSNEWELREKFLNHMEKISSLYVAIECGELTRTCRHDFDWWVDFWTKRGFKVQEEPAVRPQPIPAALMPPAPVDADPEAPAPIGPTGGMPPRPEGVSDNDWRYYCDACTLKGQDFWTKRGGISNTARAVAKYNGLPCTEVDAVRRGITRVRSALKKP